MVVEHSNQFGPLEPTRLRAFEADLGAMLPDDYRAFLLENNGGSVTPSDFRISDSEGESSLASFYGLHDGPTYSRLDAALADYADRLPRWLLPIAADQVGNAVCLGITGANRGLVYFWDHEREDGSTSALTLLARSFEDFCAGLFDLDA